MWHVYRKELLELTRDKKTLIFTLLLPTIIMPLLLFGFMTLVNNLTTSAIEENVKYAVVGEEHFPDFVEKIAANEKFDRVTLTPEQDLKAVVNHGLVDFVLVIGADTPQRLTDGLSVKVEMMYNDASQTSYILYSRVFDNLDDLIKKITQDQYRKFGLSQAQGESVNNPIELVKTTTVEVRESVGEKIGGMLPYLLILIGFSGAMYPAIDLGVGEKERGTLETLLLTPVPRFQLVFAKFLVIFSTSFISVFLSLLSFGLMATVFGPSIMSGLQASGEKEVIEVVETLLSISVGDVALMILMLVPVAAVFGSVLLSVSIYARTYKEAQNYMQPLVLCVMLPLMLALMPGVELNWIWASVPITNVALAIKEIFKGTMELSMFGVIFASTTMLAGALLYLCTWWFQREQVLFRN